jgi:hypothetical protein
MNPRIFTSSETIALQSSGLTPFDYKAVVDFLGERLVVFRNLSLDTKRNYWRRGMSISAVEITVPRAESVTVTDDTVSVDLSDGRSISVPLAWYPRLFHATQAERNHWRLIGKGQGIHWEDIDEDISVEGLLAGRPSGESQTSFKKWLVARSSRLTKRSTRSHTAPGERGR